MHVGLKDPNAAAELLTITRIHRETEEIFHALINVGRDESTERGGFACRDVDGDGTLEVEIGPKNGTGISSEVTFFWNATSGEYESPSRQSRTAFPRPAERGAPTALGSLGEAERRRPSVLSARPVTGLVSRRIEGCATTIASLPIRWCL